jgi:polysaccharide export outer membrane protein
VKIEKQLLADYFKREAYFCHCKISGFKYTINGEIGTGTKTLFQEHVTIMEAIANAETSP